MSDASTIFHSTKKSTFCADLTVSLYDLVRQRKIDTSDTESVIKKEIADALHWFAEMTKQPSTARDSIENAIATLGGSGVKAVVLAGTNNLIEAYGGLESNLAQHIAVIENLEQTFRLRDGLGALDYGEVQTSQETESNRLPAE